MTPATDDRRRRDGVVRRPHGVGHAGHQVDPAAIPEADIKPTAARIDREQVRVAGADQQPLLVARPGVGEPAVHESEVARPTGFPAPGVEQPACLPGAGVDGGHLAERGDGVERAAHHQRRVVVHAGPRQRIGFDDGVVWRGPAPRDPQPRDVVGGDPIERRVLLAGGRARVMGPFLCRWRERRPGAARGSADEEQCRGGWAQQAHREATARPPCPSARSA